MRAMFDRIAGVYDRMNSVMTAGLHHRWRARAADLAQRRPGRPRARRRLRHRRSRARAGAAGRPGRRGRRRATSPSGCSSSRARRPRGRLRRSAFEWANALELPYDDDAFDAGDGRLRRAQLLRPRARARRDGARRAARRPGRRARDHHPDAAAAVDLLPHLVRPYRAGARPRSAGERATPTPTCRDSVAASRARRSSPRRWSAAACATSATCSPPGGSSRSTPARSPRDGPRDGRPARHRAPLPSTPSCRRPARRSPG